MPMHVHSNDQMTSGKGITTFWVSNLARWPRLGHTDVAYALGFRVRAIGSVLRGVMHLSDLRTRRLSKVTRIFHSLPVAPKHS